MKIKTISWNINGLGTHAMELAQAVDKLKPDMIALSETRTNTRNIVQKMWPGAKTIQVLPKETGRATRAGVAIVARPGTELLTVSRW